MPTSKPEAPDTCGCVTIGVAPGMVVHDFDSNSLGRPVRPQILFPLFRDIETLPGVGKKTAGQIARLAGDRVVDLLWHLPIGISDRRATGPIISQNAGTIATLLVTVKSHQPGASKRSPHRVSCIDETGQIELVFFHQSGDWLARSFPVGSQKVISGRIERFGDRLQMVHPDRVGNPDEMDSIAVVEPVYPLTAGLSPKVLFKSIRTVLDTTPELPEWHDPALITREGWPTWNAALSAVHKPEALSDCSPVTVPRERLAYDELLAGQVALAAVRRVFRRLPGRRVVGTGKRAEKVIAALPFDLTEGQRRAIDQIRDDMAADASMLRLLQGDVGSGKTLVALLALTTAVEAGFQGAFLAPTEILARQHFETISTLSEACGLRVVLLTGRDSGRRRQSTLLALAEGDIDILVGTHALISDDVHFKNLALAVIDEQHRFGVHQRLALAQKGKGVDTLVMTATPIPRTLQLTAYGDMAVTQIRQRPAGRGTIDTRVVSNERVDEVIEALSRSLDRGEKAFWVCPLVEESETTELMDATARHAVLQSCFGERVGLVHGRMKGPEKDAVMGAFAAVSTDEADLFSSDRQSEIDILVATTVIEVGVDVPKATVMVVEHAERFGLAQLHQLRGRVGRGERDGVCLLLYAPPLGETARERLKTLRDTNDGFEIAEMDLKLRGAGEVLGTRQSGLPEFRVADLAQHGRLLPMASDDAKLLMEKDPHLESDRGQAIRTLLYLFEKDAAVRTLRSG